MQLAADREEVAGSDNLTGEVVFGLERLERNAKPLRKLFQGIANTDFIPARRTGGCELRSSRKRRKFIRWHAIEELLDFRFRPNGNFQEIGINVRRL